MKILYPFLFSLIFLSSSLFAQDFRVQAAAYNDTVPLAFFRDKGVHNVVASRDRQGVYHYYVGAYPTRAEAESVQQQLVEKGFSAATIIDLVEQRVLDNSQCPYASGYHSVFGYQGRRNSKTNIYFDSGKYTLSKEAYTELDRVAQTLKANPKMRLNIFGHTDSEGNAQHNMELATARARAAREYLVKRGISLERMYLRIFGEADPAIDTYDLGTVERAAAQQWNRRVALIVTESNTR